jgi:hypothetical protein
MQQTREIRELADVEHPPRRSVDTAEPDDLIAFEPRVGTSELTFYRGDTCRNPIKDVMG